MKLTHVLEENLYLIDIVKFGFKTSLTVISYETVVKLKYKHTQKTRTINLKSVSCACGKTLVEVFLHI